MSVDECIESTACGFSYPHVADLNFDDSGVFEDECFVQTIQNRMMYSKAPCTMYI